MIKNRRNISSQRILIILILIFAFYLLITNINLSLSNYSERNNVLMPSKIHIVLIGDRPIFINKFRNDLENLGVASITIIRSESELRFISSRDIDKYCILLIDSYWLEKNIKSEQLKTLVLLSLKNGSLVASYGNKTSLLFMLLKSIYPNIYAEGRNPAYYNPPLVGYRIITKYDSNYGRYYGDQIFISNSNEDDNLSEILISWMING